MLHRPVETARKWKLSFQITGNSESHLVISKIFFSENRNAERAMDPLSRDAAPRNTRLLHASPCVCTDPRWRGLEPVHAHPFERLLAWTAMRSHRPVNWRALVTDLIAILHPLAHVVSHVAKTENLHRQA